MNNKKTFIERTWIGIKRGITTPTLSKEMLDFQMNPLIRILRVVGGISCLSLLGHDHINLQGFMLYIALLFTLLFNIYHIYILIYRYKHIKFLIKSGAMDYKNSPLDKYITLLGRVILCAKGACDLATPIGTNLGLMVGLDEVLKASGRDPFFTPILGAGLNKILPKTNLDQWKDAYLDAAKQINDSKNTEKALSEIIKQAQELNDMSDDDKKDYFKVLSEMMDINKGDLDSARSKIQDLIENKPIK